MIPGMDASSSVLVDVHPGAPTAPGSTVPLAEYLGRRLQQLGVGHLFGVPGDFTLDLLDGITAVPGLRWVGSPNELGAGYAADAYARSRGLAALFTTYGVGELSAITAVAGSYAEDAAVVHVVGSPRMTAVAAGALVHHTLADGRFDHFARAAAEVTAAQEVVRLDRAPEQIDAVLLTALTERKPVYLSVPQDLALAPVPAAPLAAPLVPRSDPAVLAELADALAPLLAGAQRPVLQLGHLIARLGLGPAVQQLAERTGTPLVTHVSAKGVVDADHPLHAGDYAGSMLGEEPAVVTGADVVLHVGTVLTAELTGFGTHRRPDAHTVQLGAAVALVGDRRFERVLLADTLALVDRLLPAGTPRPAGLREDRVGDEPADGELTQETFWAEFGRWLPPHTALLAETGTAYWGALGLRLPADTVFEGQPIWSAIGWALPAVLGQGLADPGRRPVLVIGDGAAQMTVQELGTIAAAGVAPVVVLLNNRGYTIERALQSPDATYNDVADWDWGAVLAAFGGPRGVHRAVTDRAGLRAALAEAQATDALVLLEVALDRYDAPPLLRRLAAHATGRPVPA